MCTTINHLNIISTVHVQDTGTLYYISVMFHHMCLFRFTCDYFNSHVIKHDLYVITIDVNFLSVES